MTQNHQRKGSGFTIIEVMIVLAIAGLIMALVFLAVPALQRSSRNTQRKTDVSAVLAAISDYSNNNGGALPNNASCFSVANGSLTISCGATTASSTAKLGYYTSVTLATSYTTQSATAADSLTISEKTTCTNATTTGPGGQREVAALYGIESGSGYAWQCQNQ